jgi:hypothetical protein
MAPDEQLSPLPAISEEAFLRAEALRFAVRYMEVHRSSRATTLRIFDIALRALHGDSVTQINRDADEAAGERMKNTSTTRKRPRISLGSVTSLLKKRDPHV